jgi:hypothetical protein
MFFSNILFRCNHANILFKKVKHPWNIKVEGCILFICEVVMKLQPLIVNINEDGTRNLILKNDPNKAE